MKTGFDPAQREGLNLFAWYGEDVLIVHPGAYLSRITSGQLVMFRRPDGLVWCGRTWPNFYAFELEKPVDSLEALQWLADKHLMTQTNIDDFSLQEELPF
jgi:hypothetical protein